MTVDDLEQLVLGRSDVSEVVQAFAGMDEKERKKLSRTAKGMYSLLTSNRLREDTSPRLKAFVAARKVETWNLWGTDEARKATLAMYAVCPVSAINKQNIFVGHDDRLEVKKILTERKPAWLDEWVRYQLEQQIRILDFPTLREWIRTGLCRKPEHAGYYDLFAGHMMRTVDWAGKNRTPAPTISEQLLADPDLLEDVWGLFRVETLAFHTNSWMRPGADSAYETWPETLIKMAKAGHLDRSGMLDASLEGLAQDVKQNQLAGIARLHRDLEPTADEMRVRQDVYHMLLSHRAGPVAKLGIDMAAKLHQLGALEPEGFFREIQSVYLKPAKGNAVAALKVTGRVLKKSPNLFSVAIPSLREALRNDSAEVQTLAMDLMEAHAAGLSTEQVEELVALADFIKPAVQARFAAFLKIEPRAGEDQPGEECAEPGGAQDAHGGNPYVPISNGLGDKLILPTIAPLVPIDSLDDLIAAVSHAVEQVDSPDEIERIIDAVSRLCDQRPSDFGNRTAPLLHRLHGGMVSLRGLVHGTESTRAVAALVMSWLTRRVHVTQRSEHVMSASDAFVPMIDLLNQASQRVARGESRHLLSAPTHQNGWIDPRIWIARLIADQSKGFEYEPTDFCYALLRLTPDGRPEALARCVELSGHERRIANFALGGDERPRPDDRRHHALWITAARARDPAADWSDLFEPLGLDDDLPDATRPAVFAWRAYLETNKNYNHSYEWKQPKFELQRTAAAQAAAEVRRPRMPASISAMLSGTISVNWRDLPTAALNHSSRTDERWTYDFTSFWASQWIAHLWPQNPAAAFAAAASKLALRMDQDSSSMEPGAGYLYGLFQKNRPWGEMGHLTLLLGVAGKDADSRGLSIDAMIEGIESGQFDPEMFGAMTAKFAAGGWMKPGRIADAMQQAARMSPLHAWAVGEAIEQALPGLDLKAANMFAVVELLLACKLTLRQPVRPYAAATLSEIKGEGKVAKAARKLLELGASDVAILRRVRHLADQGRASTLLRREGADAASR